MIPIVQPQIFVVGETQINVPGMIDYLKIVNGMEWLEERFYLQADGNGSQRLVDIDTDELVPASEALTEFMGRLCYKSWAPGINPNVTRVRTERALYLSNIIGTGHGSVLEHATVNFAVSDMARFVYDELVRHRVGVAISAQSGRYVRMGDIRFRLPPFLKQKTQDLMAQAVSSIEDLYAQMLISEDIDNLEDFGKKKKVTSALRRVAPHGMAWDFGWSANIRTIRHVIEMRSDPGAEEEIRIFADLLAREMRTRAPYLFDDYVEQPVPGEPTPDWVTDNRKV